MDITIRCQECTYSKKGTYSLICKLLGCAVDDDFSCTKAEKKTGEETDYSTDRSTGERKIERMYQG